MKMEDNAAIASAKKTKNVIMVDKLGVGFVKLNWVTDVIPVKRWRNLFVSLSAEMLLKHEKKIVILGVIQKAALDVKLYLVIFVVGWKVVHLFVF